MSKWGIYDAGDFLRVTQSIDGKIQHFDSEPGAKPAQALRFIADNMAGGDLIFFPDGSVNVVLPEGGQA